MPTEIMTEIFKKKKILHMVIDISLDKVYKSNI